MGALIGYINVVAVALLLSFFFGKGRLNADMATCGANLKRMEVVLREYTNENEGMFPPLSSQPGILMFSPEAVPPKNSIIGPLPLTCPTARYAKKGTRTQNATYMQTSPFDDQSYFYLGYAVLDDDDVEAFAQAYRKQVAEGGAFDKDLVVQEGEGTRVLHRLSLDVKEVWRATQDPHSVSPHEGRESGFDSPCTVTTDVPVLIERDLGHVYTDWDGPPRGANVLYLYDGIRFVERGTWPMTEKTQRILAELAE